MKYIANLFLMVGLISIAIGAIALANAEMMAAVRLMAGGVVAMGASSILSEIICWAEELRYE